MRAGEILGIAGVQGNGQTELAEALLGLTPIPNGIDHLDGKSTDRADTEGEHRRWPRLRPGGPQAGWLRRHVHRRREPDLDHYAEPPFARGMAMDLTR